MFTKKCKKYTALVLCVLMLLSCFSLGAFAEKTQEQQEDNTPIIWVGGQGASIYDKDGKMVFDVPEPDGYIENAVKACLPSLIEAILLGGSAIDKYKEMLLSYFAPLYDAYRLDKNGEATDGTHVLFDWTAEVKTMTKEDFTSDLSSYYFRNDWRLSPLENANRLHIYIQNVLKATGYSKINLYGRCEGCTILTAYLKQYGDTQINKIATNVSTANGIETVSKFFCGKLAFDAENIDTYVSDNLIVGDEITNEFFWATWDALKSTGGLNLTLSALGKLYESVIKQCMPDCLLASYATFPGIWSMVDEEDYEDALSFVFYSDEIRSEYAGLIAKIKDYHDNVKIKQNDMLLELKANGHEIGVFAKYGYPTLCILADAEKISDGNTRLSLATYGATTADYGEALSGEYIRQQVLANKGQYISPDKMVDTSTCLFPDTTWIVKGVFHNIFPIQVDDMMLKFFRTPGMTVNTFEEYPQYSVYHCRTRWDRWNDLTPMTAENCNIEETLVQEGAEKGEELNFLQKIKRLFDAFKAFFSALINKTLSFSFELGHF